MRFRDEFFGVKSLLKTAFKIVNQSGKYFLTYN